MRIKKLSVFTACACVLTALSSAGTLPTRQAGNDCPVTEVTLTPDGVAHLFGRDVSIGPVVFERGWRSYSLSAVRNAKADPATGRLAVELRSRSERIASGTASLRMLPDGRAEYALTMTFDRDFETACYGLRIGAEIDAYAGRRWSSDAAEGKTLPIRYGSFPLGAVKNLRSFRLSKADASGPLTFALEKPFSVDMYDGRKYGGTTYDFRLQYAPVPFRKGETVTRSCMIDAGGPMRVRMGEPIVVNEGADWLPMPYLKDPLPGSALDLSSSGLHDAPAGKHGRVIAKDGHFEFVRCPGVKQRFSGVNLCGRVNCPEASIRRSFTLRLKRLGYNSVRFHHHESDLVSGSADRMTFNPGMLDRFDAFVKELIDEGLYFTTDLYVSRPVEWKDIGIDRPGRMTPNAYKVLVSAGYGPAVENWKRFARAFLTHVNPYTKRSLIDEPALVSLVLVNEAHLGMDWNAFLSVPELKARYEAWKKANPGRDVLLFRSQVEAETNAELAAWLRSLGVKNVLSTDNNAPLVTSTLLACDPFDCVDQHAYLDHPSFLGRNIRYADDNPMLRNDNNFTRRACIRDWGKPFSISEWNYGGTSSYRSMAGLLIGSLAALQDWDAMWRFCCSHNDKRLADNAGWVDSFELASDPLKQATDFAFNLLYLRGDLAPCRERIALRIGKGDLLNARNLSPFWRRTALFEAGYGVITGEDVPGVRTFDFGDWIDAEHTPYPVKGGNGFTFDPTNGTLTVETPLTCGGFSEAGAVNDAGVLVFRPAGHRATVTAMSLDGIPLSRSRRILITHLTNVLSARTTFTDETRRIVSYLGDSDVDRLVANGSAEITLSVGEPSSYSVWALATDGRRLARVPTTVEDGRLRFTADVSGEGGARLYYEVAKDDRSLMVVPDLKAPADGTSFYGDKASNTVAIQSAIDSCSSAGGGRVVLSGGTFLTKPLELKSGVELHIAADAVLLGSDDWKDYPDRPLRNADSSKCPRGRSSSLIWADGAERISITGPGRLDCNGAAFLKEATPHQRQWGFKFVRKGGARESPPRVVLFVGCKNVCVRDLTVGGLPGGWAFWAHDCDDMLFDNVRISADVQCANNDGIHVNCSRDVMIRNCDITTGDDAVVVRANSRSLKENKVCENVVVSNCALRSWSCGVRIGWCNDGVIRNCLFENLRMRDTTFGVGIVLPPKRCIPSDYGREDTLIENLTFRNVAMDGIYAHPLYCRISDDPGTRCAAVRDLLFENVSGYGLQQPYFEGTEAHPFERFVFRDCSWRTVGDDVLPGSAHHGAASKERFRDEKFVHARGFKGRFGTAGE